MKKNLLFLILFTLLIAKVNAQSKIEMPSIFSDNMVLQQNSQAPFWGKAVPGLDVNVKGSWGSAVRAKVQNDSSWLVRVKTPKAGGPFEVNVTIGKETITYKNVMIGEVWVCSGQSNMEMPLEGWPPRDTIWTGSEEIKNAANPNIRIFTVTKSVSNVEKFNCSGKWLVSASETAAKFSATAYFFGIKLNKELNIPIGLINTSWGGTPIESWMGGKTLSSLDEFKPIIAKLEKSSEETERLNNWLQAFPVIDIKQNLNGWWKGLDFRDSSCFAVNCDDSKWPEMVQPVEWGSTSLSGFDGACWFRKKISIPKTWLGRELILELGPIDDMDETFVNGVKVGEFMEPGGPWQTERKYPIAASVVNDTILTIAVRVLDYMGGGGIRGSKEQLNVHTKDGNESITVAGIWKYMPVAELRNLKFYVYGGKGESFLSRPNVQLEVSAGAPTALYNAMIAPLIPFSIKGVIWYQGEANTFNPELYKKLFPMMITNWREEWKEGEFPFYYVQIAPYNYTNDYGKDIQSEKLREAQMLTLSTPRTGMAVTMDIGNVENIHPGNKKDVGERLARWALVKDYHKKSVFSGPLYKSFEIKKDKIFITFEYADGGLVIKERNGENNFIIAGSDGVFVKAEVKAEGKKLIISSSTVKEPRYVRYAWSNTSEATLFNKAGLPASSFRTDALDDSKLAARK